MIAKSHPETMQENKQTKKAKKNINIWKWMNCLNYETIIVVVVVVVVKIYIL